jgi:hypothetical protein
MLPKVVPRYKTWVARERGWRDLKRIRAPRPAVTSWQNLSREVATHCCFCFPWLRKDNEFHIHCSCDRDQKVCCGNCGEIAATKFERSAKNWALQLLKIEKFPYLNQKDCRGHTYERTLSTLLLLTVILCGTVTKVILQSQLSTNLLRQ